MNYQRDFKLLVSAATLVAVTLGLQGCGEGGHSPGIPPTPGPVKGWNLPPISVKGQHLYYPNGTQFHVQGIGFPDINTDNHVDDWIAVLRRINSLSPNVNAVRIYRPPECAKKLGSACFEPFMREADKLGIYVLVPGSGVEWGFFPGTEDGCYERGGVDKGLQGCYEFGGVLGFGRMIVANFNYPNTLAIVLANEIEQNLKALPVLKAYARDMKSWMQTCYSENDSPSKGTMRQIPLMYAATDSDVFADQAGYLFCDSPDVSIDIYGLNVERWVNDAGGKTEYDKINGQVKDGQWQGAFLHSEEGGPNELVPPNPARTWKQLPNFFTQWPYINGFFGYAYNGKVGFNMFDGTSATATELPDGKTFFAQIGNIATYPTNVEPKVGKSNKCASSVTAKDHTQVTMASYDDLKIYETGPSGWAKNCPKPPPAETAMQVTIQM